MAVQWHTIANRYVAEFGAEPIFVRAPGRINLIGEHTDYNDGFVMPAAVNQSILFAIGPSSNDDECTLISLDYDSVYKFRLSDLKRVSGNTWQNYILGVIVEIQKTGRKLSGFNFVFGGDIPKGAGMSSSAALECGCCFALSELNHLQMNTLEMIKLSQMAEHNYVGVKCGIMDQFASMMGKRGSALLLDCKSMEFNYVPVPQEDFSIVLCNSNVEHNLANSEYNVRRSQCEEGLALIQAEFNEIKSLRDATHGQLIKVKYKMDPTIYSRCKYVIDENKRVHDFADALDNGDLDKMRNILRQAQHGMKLEYEITCPEIDFMADFANSYTGVIGSRMMGGGFGGCTINLVHKNVIAEFINDVQASYYDRFKIAATPIRIELENGVSLISKEIIG